MTLGRLLLLLGCVTALRPGEAAAQAVAPTVTRFYQSLSYESLASLKPRTTAWDLAAAAGLDKDTVGKSGNPDPEWILGWVARDFSKASDNAQLALLAARNRTWGVKCKQESAALRAAQAALAAQHRPELERLGTLDNYYERLAGYGKLFRAVRDAIAAVPQAQRRGGGLLPSSRRGPPFEILKALAAYRRGSTRAFLVHDTQSPEAPLFEVKTADYERDGRPLSPDADFEDQLYCVEALDGTAALPPFESSLLRPTDQQRRGVKWPAFLAAKGELARRNDELVKASAEALRLPPPQPVVKVEDLGAFDKDAKEPTIARVQDYVVKAVSDGGRILDLFLRKEASFDYDCKVIRFEKKCKAGARISEYKVRVTSAELPVPLDVQVGDKVTLFADLEERAHKPGKEKINLREVFFTMKMKGRHLLAVERSGKAVFRFP